MQTDDNLRLKANNYLQLETPYLGEAEVVHYLEMLRDEVGFDNLRKAVKNPLKGVKIAAYYGCLLLRPGSVMAFDDPENPTIMESFIRAIGAEPVIYSQRNECCGGYMALEDKPAAQKRVDAIVKSAMDAGRGNDHHRLSAVHVQPGRQRHGERSAGEVLHRAAGRGAGRRRRRWKMSKLTTEDILRISGVNPRKCMKCGKCSGTCPAYDEMEYHPHQFVSMVERGQIDKLMASKSIYRCLTCFACLERCPRNVEPAKLIEAVRLAVIRQQGMNHMTENDIPALLDEKLPQQAIVSAMRKYKK